MINILVYKSDNCHHKNLNSLNKYNNINFTYSSGNEILNIEKYDCVLSFSEVIDISKYPNTYFIFGPQFSVFPDDKLKYIKGNNSYFNCLSQWVCNYWKSYEISQGVNFVKLPFGVETDKFTEINPNKREKVFIYYKQRNPNELNYLINFLNKMHISFHIFNYRGKYKENEYLQYLQESKYGIWLGCHESQGFALEEALSCNVPLLVWNVSSMNQEFGQNYSDIPATSVSYWDESCGEYFYHSNELEEKFQIFLSKFDTYNPRQFIMNNLSMEVCEKRLIDFIIQNKSVLHP